jgi:hypothetical protein
MIKKFSWRDHWQQGKLSHIPSCCRFYWIIIDNTLWRWKLQLKVVSNFLSWYRTFRYECNYIPCPICIVFKRKSIICIDSYYWIKSLNKIFHVENL